VTEGVSKVETETEKLERELRTSEEKRKAVTSAVSDLSQTGKPGQEGKASDVRMILEQLQTVVTSLETSKAQMENAAKAQDVIRSLTEDNSVLRGKNEALVQDQARIVEDLSGKNQSQILDVVRQAVTDDPELVAEEKRLLDLLGKAILGD
jgi:hypothetical protein